MRGGDFFLANRTVEQEWDSVTGSIYQSAGLVPEFLIRLGFHCGWGTFDPHDPQSQATFIAC